MNGKTLGVPLLWIALALAAASQTGTPTPTFTPPPDVEGQDSDPTRPVVWSIREEYYNFQNGNWANSIIIRRDKAFMANRKRWWAGARGFLTRFDLPISVASLGGENQGGLGDLYTQVLYVPFVKNNYAVAGGTGLSLPTATDRFLGTGKVTISPVFAPIRFFPKRGMGFIKFQDYISVGGDSSRPDLHYFSITPLLVWRLNKRWWTQFDGETKTNFNGGGWTNYKAGILLGRMVKSRIGVWVKVEVPFGGHRDGDFSIKTSFFKAK